MAQVSPVRSRVLRRTLPMLALILVPLGGESAEPTAATPGLPSELARAVHVQSVSDFETVLTQLRDALWKIDSGTENFGVDARKHSIADYANRWVLAPQNEARLRDLLAKATAAQQAGDAATLQATLHDAAPLLTAELYRLSVVTRYVFFLTSFAHHKVLLDNLLTDRPSSEVTAIRNRIDERTEHVADTLAAALAAESPPAWDTEAIQMQTAVADTYRAYNEERGKLAEQVSARMHHDGVAMPFRVRATPCASTAAGTSGSQAARLDAQGSPALDDYYPRSSQRYAVEGKVTLSVTVTPAGCMERAEVYTSSGVDELDDAAMRWAEQAKYIPAERDHRSAEGLARFAVKFALSD